MHATDAMNFSILPSERQKEKKKKKYVTINSPFDFELCNSHTKDINT